MLSANSFAEELIGSFGGVSQRHYRPRDLVANPLSPKHVTLELLLASQSHLGPLTSLWNPANAQYIHGIRQGIHIISLDVTAAHLRRAANIIRGVTYAGGLVLFVGSRKGQDQCVIRAADLAGGCHLFERWIPGSITNSLQILKDCKVKYVNELDQEVEANDEQPSRVGKDLSPLIPMPIHHPLPIPFRQTMTGGWTPPLPFPNFTISSPSIPCMEWIVRIQQLTSFCSLRCVQMIAGVLGRAGEEGKVARLADAQAQTKR